MTGAPRTKPIAGMFAAGMGQTIAVSAGRDVAAKDGGRRKREDGD